MHAGLTPEYLDKLKVYQAGKPIDELVREKGLTRVSKLASNENPLGPSPYAIREMTKELWEVHRYPDMHAYKLKNKLSEIYNLKADNIVLGNGSEGIMGYVARAILQPGNEVLTCDNTFIGFYILARSAGAILKTVPLTEDYRFNVEALKDSISHKTKVIYIANPNNPTGTYISKQEFDYLMDYVPDDVLVLIDEAYYEFAIGRDDYPDSMEYRYDNVLTLRTFSKAYGLSGIRVGYGFAHSDLIKYLNRVKLPFEPNLIGQVGAVGALTDIPHLKQTIENNFSRYVELMDYLNTKEFNPIKSVTNFVAFKTGSGEASDFMFNRLLNEGVIIRPLKANEMPDFVRVSLGTKDEMNHYYEAMDKILPEYDKKFGRAKGN